MTRLEHVGILFDEVSVQHYLQAGEVSFKAFAVNGSEIVSATCLDDEPCFSDIIQLLGYMAGYVGGSALGFLCQNWVDEFGEPVPTLNRAHTRWLSDFYPDLRSVISTHMIDRVSGECVEQRTSLHIDMGGMDLMRTYIPSRSYNRAILQASSLLGTELAVEGVDFDQVVSFGLRTGWMVMEGEV